MVFMRIKKIFIYILTPFALFGLSECAFSEICVQNNTGMSGSNVRVAIVKDLLIDRSKPNNPVYLSSSSKIIDYQSIAQSETECWPNHSSGYVLVDIIPAIDEVERNLNPMIWVSENKISTTGNHSYGLSLRYSANNLHVNGVEDGVRVQKVPFEKVYKNAK